MPRIIQNRIFAIAQKDAARLFGIGLADALPILVMLVQKKDLQHHFDGGGLVEVEVELLKYLKLGFHEHFGNKFDS